MNRKRRKRRRKQRLRSKRLKNGFIVLVALLAVCGLLSAIRVQSITITGEQYQSEQQIRQEILSGVFQDSTILLWWQGKSGKLLKRLPFLESVKVTVVTPLKVAIDLQEKEIIGCLSDKEQFISFDSQGVCQMIGSTPFEGVSLVSGIVIDPPVLYQPIESEEVLKLEEMLETLRSLKTSALKADEIRFDKNGQIQITVGKFTANVGNSSLEVRIHALAAILASMEEGAAGTLDLEGYESKDDDVTFQPSFEIAPSIKINQKIVD